MADIEHKLVIPHPISEVYTHVIEYENPDSMRRWQGDLISVGVTAGNPLRTGSMIGITRRFRGSTVFVNLDVIDLQRNKRFEVKGVHGRFAFHRIIEFSPNGRETNIHDQINLHMPWFFAPFRPLMHGSLSKQTEKEWLALIDLI